MSCTSLIQNYDTSEGDECSYISVDRKKVNTIRDLVIEVEAEKLFKKKKKKKTYIRYQIENEMYSVTCEELSSVCETYDAWFSNEWENKITDSDLGVHVSLLGIGNFNYYVVYLGTIFSDNVTILMDPNLDIDTLTYCINHADIGIVFYETNFQSKTDTLKERCSNTKEFILIEKAYDSVNSLGYENHSEEISSLTDILNKYNGQKAAKEIDPDDNSFNDLYLKNYGKEKSCCSYS